MLSQSTVDSLQSKGGRSSVVSVSVSRRSSVVGCQSTAMDCGLSTIMAGQCGSRGSLRCRRSGPASRPTAPMSSTGCADDHRDRLFCRCAVARHPRLRRARLHLASPPRAIRFNRLPTGQRAVPRLHVGVSRRLSGSRRAARCAAAPRTRPRASCAAAAPTTTARSSSSIIPTPCTTSPSTPSKDWAGQSIHSGRCCASSW